MHSSIAHGRPLPRLLPALAARVTCRGDGALSRIALVDTFDNPFRGAYNLMVGAQGTSGPTVQVSAANVAGAPTLAVFEIRRAAVAPDWTPIHLSPDRAFGIAGTRLLRYGPGANGVYVYRTVSGLDVDAVGFCEDAFFPPSPAGPGKTCAVARPGRPDTPLQVQIRSPWADTCMTRAGTVAGVPVSMASCAAASTNVWTLQPTAYLY